jgi:hypothetical protein
MVRLLAFLVGLLLAGQVAAQPFAPGETITASKLNAALAAPTITGGTINSAAIGQVTPGAGSFTTLRSTGLTVFSGVVALNAGSVTGLSTFGIRSSGTGAFDLRPQNTENLTANRTLTFGVADASRVFNLAGAGTTSTFTFTGSTNVTFPTSGTLLAVSGGALPPSSGGTGVANNDSSTLTMSGNFATTLTRTGATNVTLPTSGTLATLAGAEELTNKTLNASVGKGTWTASGTWTLPALTLGGTVTGGGNQLNNIVLGASTLGGTISGGGNQINNVVIGTSTPLAGSFTTLAATGATITGGTVTTSTPFLDMTQTWNQAATVFTGIKLNVTNSNSLTTSKLLDLQIGGSTKFSVNRLGDATFLGPIHPGDGVAAQSGGTIKGGAITGASSTTQTLVNCGGNAFWYVTNNSKGARRHRHDAARRRLQHHFTDGVWRVHIHDWRSGRE